MNSEKTENHLGLNPSPETKSQKTEYRVPLTPASEAGSLLSGKSRLSGDLMSLQKLDSSLPTGEGGRRVYAFITLTSEETENHLGLNPNPETKSEKTENRFSSKF